MKKVIAVVVFLAALGVAAPAQATGTIGGGKTQAVPTVSGVDWKGQTPLRGVDW